MSKALRKHRLELVLPLALVTIRGSSLAIKFIFTIFIARYLNLEALGFFGLLSAATIVIPIILGLGLGYTLCRRAVTADLEQIVVDLKYYGLFFVIIYSLPTIISICIGVFYSKIVLTLSALFIIMLEHLNGSSYQLLLNMSRPLAANILHFIRTTVWAVLFMIFAFFIHDLRNLESLVLFWGCGSAFSVLCFAFLVKDWPWGKVCMGVSFLGWLRPELAAARPAYFNGVFETTSIYLDRYLIGIFLGLELTGVFVFFWQITSALGNLLWTGVVQVTRPKLVKSFKNLDGEYESIYRKCLTHAMIGSSVASAISIVALNILLPYLQKPLVGDYFGIYYLMILAFLLTVVKETQKLRFYSQHRDDLTLKTSIFSLINACLFTFFLVVYAGLWGGALAMVLSVSSSVAMQAFYRKKYGI